MTAPGRLDVVGKEVVPAPNPQYPANTASADATSALWVEPQYSKTRLLMLSLMAREFWFLVHAQLARADAPLGHSFKVRSMTAVQ